MELYLLLSFLVVLILITTLMYVSLQRLDFSKLFKANSTVQIRAIILCVSCTVGVVLALGFCEILELIINLK